MKRAFARQRTNRLIDLYVAYLGSLSHDAGWHGDSTLARLIDFAGDPPEGTGYDQSNLKMINEIQYLRNTHAEMPRIQLMMRLLHQTDGPAYQAMLVDHVYRNRSRRVGETVIKFTPKRIVQELEISLREYENSVRRGRRKLYRLDESLPIKEELAATEPASLMV